jgi:signal peptidase II
VTLQQAPQTRPAGRTRTVRAAYLAMLAAAVVMVGLDQWTKQLALDGLSDGSVHRVLGGLIYFDLTFNAGAAFSFGTGVTWIFPTIAILISIGILWYARRLQSWPWALAFGLILGGALGNLWDRLFRAPGPMRGHVVDFISLFAPAGERFAIFNIADSALSVGVVLAIALELFGLRRDGMRLLSDRRGAAGAESGQPGDA